MTLKFLLGALIAGCLILLYITNPTNFDPNCQGQMVPKHCVE